MKPRFILWIIILLVVVALFVDIPKIPKQLNTPVVNLPFNKKIPSTNLFNVFGLFSVKLGLDLQGGTQLVLQTQMDKIPDSQRDSALESARGVIERRVNLFGVSEALVQSSKLGNERRILVELPGIKDASQAADLVGRTAQLQFREIPDKLSPEATKSGLPAVFFAKQTNLTGSDLQMAQVTYGTTGTGSPQVEIQFNSSGAKKFADLTKRNIGKQLPIFLDDVPLTAPVVQQEIDGGNAVITGNFDVASAKQLAIQLNAGALPVPIKIIEERSIGATLGQESVNKSLVAGVIGILIVIVYMGIYYGRLGLIADLALVIYSLFVLAIFKTGLFILPPVTLTLAGVAGFILSIGMAVDANILIFERMKEEMRWGRGPKNALDLGFNRAWSSIKDSNISSLLTAGILYTLGTGLVKGFAITLAIGVLVSMFTAVVVSRTLLKLFMR